MTIKECIDIVDNAKPNQYTIKEKVMWLSFVDETIINDVLKTHEGYDGRYDDFTGYTEDKLSVPLIVPSPYDRLYPQYIKMMIDSENGETARYNNSAALYNTYLTEYKKWYNKTHMPINGTQDRPAPVNININSAISEAQIENLKRQLYYMLSEDFSEATSRDKLYDIVTSYVNNNLEMLKAKLSMSYKGRVSELPAEAKIGDVYKLDSTIYRSGAYYIPISMGDVGEVDGNSRYYFDSIFGEEITDIVSAMVSDGRVNEFALENNESKFVIPLIGAGFDNGYYIDSTFKTYVYMGTHFTHILVPEEYGEEYFADRKAIRFHKGELVVYGENGWVSADADILETIQYDFDAFKREVGDRLNETIDWFATVDLDNVSNEAFKAKADAAGVGGTSGAMVFKGKVDTLPETANDGDVYKTDVETYSWTFEGEVTNYNDTLYCGDNGIDCDDRGYGSDVWSVINELYNNKYQNALFALRLEYDNRVFDIRVSEVSQGSVPEEAGYPYSQYYTVSGVVLNGDAGVGYVSMNTKVKIYSAPPAPQKSEKIYVRHNGEWV